MQTFSDRELDRYIAKAERDLATLARQGNGSGWTAEKTRETLAYYQAQRALPRAQRCKFTRGTL